VSSSISAPAPPATTTGSATAAPAPSIPWLGIVAVLFGAISTTLTTRLTSAGLADVRGAIGAGFDEGAWITTAFGASQMFIGPATVWLGRAFGVRATLLAGCFLYGVGMLLIPVAPSLPWVLALQCVAGLGSGTFIPLAAVFVLLNLPPDPTSATGIRAADPAWHQKTVKEFNPKALRDGVTRRPLK
jgi:DHA2 family multidrug resistance protein